MVTAWDVLEHVATGILPTWLDGVRETGCELFVGTISHRLDPGWPGGDGEPLHLTVKPWNWWKALFERKKFSLNAFEPLGERATFFSLEVLHDKP